MPSEGPNICTSHDVATVTAWQNPANITTDDTTNYAYKPWNAVDYIESVTHNFSIPATAVIDGIEWSAFMLTAASGLTADVKLRYGTLAGDLTDSLETSTVGGGSIVTAGGANELWGYASWAPDVINNNIGSRLLANRPNVNQVRVYYIKLTVYYTTSIGADIYAAAQQTMGYYPLPRKPIEVFPY